MNTRPIYKGLGHRAIGLLPLLILALFWEVAAREHLINPLFLPPVSAIIISFFTAIGDGSMIENASLTLRRCIEGYASATAVGIPLGFLMGRYRWFHFSMNTIVESLRPIPSAAIIPIAILFLGIEERMKIFVIAFGSLWPIMLNTYQGVKVTDPLLIDTGRTLRLSPLQINLKLILPASSPFISAGLRISLAISLILAITSEMIAGSDGLGFLILDCERSFRYPKMYAGILTLGIIGSLLNFVFVLLHRKFLFWSETLRPEI